MGWCSYVLFLMLAIQYGSYNPAPLDELAINFNRNGSPNGPKISRDELLNEEKGAKISNEERGDPPCPKKRKRILGGDQYHPRGLFCGDKWDVPDWENWIASIKIDNVKWNSKDTCGGALISEQHIVTALHCLMDMEGNLGFFPRDKVEIYFDRENVEKWKGITFKPLAYFYPNMPNKPVIKKYRLLKDDIAVIKLHRPIKPKDKLRKMPISTRNGIPAPTTGDYWMAGWGYMGVNPWKKTTFLQYTNKLPGIPCPVSDRIQATSMCFKNTNRGPATCPGDSGSPGVVFFNGTWHLQGIHSYGMNTPQSGYRTGYCNETESISVDVDVYKYRRQIEKWIKQ